MSETVTKVRRGEIKEFLHRNIFRVKLYNGVLIDAVMPNELLPAFDINVPITRWHFQYVDVELRDPPQLAKIISIERPTGLCGA